MSHLRDPTLYPCKGPAAKVSPDVPLRAKTLWPPVTFQGTSLPRGTTRGSSNPPSHSSGLPTLSLPQPNALGMCLRLPARKASSSKHQARKDPCSPRAHPLASGPPLSPAHAVLCCPRPRWEILSPPPCRGCLEARPRALSVTQTAGLGPEHKDTSLPSHVGPRGLVLANKEHWSQSALL